LIGVDWIIMHAKRRALGQPSAVTFDAKTGGDFSTIRGMA